MEMDDEIRDHVEMFHVWISKDQRKKAQEETGRILEKAGATERDLEILQDDFEDSAESMDGGSDSFSKAPELGVGEVGWGNEAEYLAQIRMNSKFEGMGGVEDQADLDDAEAFHTDQGLIPSGNIGSTMAMFSFHQSAPSMVWQGPYDLSLIYPAQVPSLGEEPRFQS
jgi:hypothetical protein